MPAPAASAAAAGARVAEHVRQPQLRAAAAELALEEPLAVQQLAHQRLAGRQVGVRLDPGAADRDPLPRGRRRRARGRTARARARPAMRSAAPGSARSGARGRRPSAAAASSTVRTSLRQVSSSGHSHAVSRCACPIADMRCSSPRRPREQRRPGAAVAVEREGVQPGQQLPAQAGSTPGASSSARSTSRSCHSVHASASKRASSQRRSAKSPARACAGLAEAEHVVARELELERHPLAARAASTRTSRRAAPAAAGVQPLHGPAVQPQRRLAARVERRGPPVMPAQRPGPPRSPRSQ